MAGSIALFFGAQAFAQEIDIDTSYPMSTEPASFDTIYLRVLM